MIVIVIPTNPQLTCVDVPSPFRSDDIHPPISARGGGDKSSRKAPACPTPRPVPRARQLRGSPHLVGQLDGSSGEGGGLFVCWRDLVLGGARWNELAQHWRERGLTLNSARARRAAAPRRRRRASTRARHVVKVCRGVLKGAGDGMKTRCAPGPLGPKSCSSTAREMMTAAELLATTRGPRPVWKLVDVGVG